MPLINAIIVVAIDLMR